MSENWNNFWHEDWDRVRERFAAWWHQEGLILDVAAPRVVSRLPDARPVDSSYHLSSGVDTKGFTGPLVDAETAWLDPARRVGIAERHMAGVHYGAEAFPYFDTNIGPGNLATFIGSAPRFDPDTVWYEPRNEAPDDYPPLVFDPQHPWFLKQKAIVEAGVAARAGRFLVGMPDLIENVDILSSLRDSAALMFDMIERPDWVRARVAEINAVYFQAFDALFDLIRDPWGGNAFSAFHVWGPGRTAKVQCDAAAMISPKMLAEFVVPALTEQCAWLDYSLFHLDGTQAMVHLDLLLEIEPLNGIEWTPQAGRSSGGDPVWFEMYKRILDAGKSLQAIGVKPDEVIPLIETLGTNGVYIMTHCDTEAEARDLEAAVERYRGGN